MTNPSMNRLFTDLMPKAPCFDDLVPKALEPPQPTLADPPKPVGIFVEMLGGEPAHLLLASRRHPEEFSLDVVDLLNGLYVGTRNVENLSADELRLLDKATVQYLTTNWQAPKKQPKRQPVARSIQEPAPQLKVAGVSEQELPSFWWLG